MYIERHCVPTVIYALRVVVDFQISKRPSRIIADRAYAGALNALGGHSTSTFAMKKALSGTSTLVWRSVRPHQLVARGEVCHSVLQLAVNRSVYE